MSADLPDAADGQFARRLFGIYQSLNIGLGEGIKPSVTGPVTNRGFQPTHVNLAELKAAAEDIRADAAALLNLLAEERADRDGSVVSR